MPDTQEITMKAEDGARNREQKEELVGYFVWTSKWGYAYRNKLHATQEAAEAALAGVVWHNRPNFEVRAVYV